MTLGVPYVDRLGLALAGCGIGFVSAQLVNVPIGHITVVAALVAAVGVAIAAMGSLRDRKRVKRATSKAEQAMRIIESMPALAWFADANGKFLYMSRSPRAFTGLPREDLVATEDDEFGFRKVIHPDDLDRLLAAWRRSLRTGRDYHCEHRMWRAGAYRWYRSSGLPKRDPAGRIVGWYGTTIDIDEQKMAEAALRESERSLQQLIDTVPVLIWCLSPEGNPTYFNKQMVEYGGVLIDDLGSSETERFDAVVRTIIHPDDAVAVRNAVATAVRTGEGFSLRHRLRRSDGVYRWVDARAEPMRNAGGEIVRWYGVCLDIDAQMHAEDALRQSEQNLQRLVDALPIHIWSWTPAGKLAYVNKRSLEDLGLSKANFEDTVKVAETLVHPEDAPEVLRISANCLRTGDPFMMRYRRLWKDGSYRWLEGRCEPLRDRDGTILHWYQVSIDIGDQVRAEEALRNTTRQLQQMIDAVPINILSFDASRRLTYASKRYADGVGSPPAHVETFEALARHLAHPDDLPAMLKRALDGFTTGTPFVNRFRRRDKDGAYPWIEARAQPLHDASGAIVQWYVVSIDIENEVRTQEELRERERFLWQLVETLPAMIDCASPKGEPIYRSQRLRQFLGYDLEALDGMGKTRLDATLDAGVHPDDIEGVRERYAHCLATGEPYARRHRLRRFDGEYRWVETRAEAMRNADGAIVQWNVMCLDIDAEVRAQEALRLAQERLARASQAASLAELSASIAHEVNQPLAAVVANSYACQRWLMAEPPNAERAHRTVKSIIRDANAAADVVSRIRALFRQSMDSRSSAAIGSIMAEVRELMAEEAMRRSVQMHINVEDRLPPVEVDRVQLQQVLINLIRNGMEAMDALGGDKILQVCARELGDSVQVEVSDRGGGIESPDRIFEPFFTTKAQGMGMGLAICRSIIESHGGKLWVETNKSHGTTFLFTLPIQAKEAA
ncbi:hypothetical protein ASC80_04840 [Afipia sp. Root123D2]|uniref:PAS domain-containing protein n=1 Tax=Afipia sp. Root123D2 TaxID=1736436 RepID=UPI000713F805|nr:PAS domain-containing protein [Afipia sp. Root123D2]KQW22682.1 hypothetical protein ASC80_04840 [Afipia sp. Root123D2]